MSKHFFAGVPATAVGVLAMMIMLGTSWIALAADDCLAGPDRPPGPGGHWYYHLDRANDRKCWYLVQPDTHASAPELPQPQPQPQPQASPESSTFDSFFSALSAGFPASPNGPQAASPADARNAPAAHPSDPGSDAPPPRQVSAVRETMPAKPHHAAHVRPTAGEADGRPAAASGQSERDVLLQEFLRWRDRR